MSKRQIAVCLYGCSGVLPIRTPAAALSTLSLRNAVRYAGWGIPQGSTTLSSEGGIGALISITRHDQDGTTNYYPKYDLNANIIGLVDESGNQVARYEYSAFGQTLIEEGPAAQHNPFRFSTKYLDKETDLYYFGYRYYSPSLKQWLSEDPIGEQGGINLYGYCENDPVNLRDELGMEIEWVVAEGEDWDATEAEKKVQLQQAKALFRKALTRRINKEKPRSVEVLEKVRDNTAQKVTIVVQSPGFEKGGGGRVFADFSELSIDDDLPHSEWKENLERMHRLKFRRYKEDDGLPVDAEVLFNPDSKVALEPGVRMRGEPLLVHELAHAYQMMTGTMSRERENQEKYATKIENIHRHAMDPSHQRIRQRTIYRYMGKVWKVEYLPPDRAALKAMQEKEKRERLEHEAAMKRELEAVRREIGIHAQYE